MADPLNPEPSEVCEVCERAIPDDEDVLEVEATLRNGAGGTIRKIKQQVCEDCARQAVADTLAIAKGGVRVTIDP